MQNPVTPMPAPVTAPPAATRMTARPELAVGLTVNVSPKVRGVVGWANVIVWFAFEIVIVLVALAGT